MPDESETAAEAGEATEQEEKEKEQEGVRAEVERTAPCECVIHIQADSDHLQERYQQELAELQAEVQLPGFRRGKAPVGLVERRMGSSLRTDLVSSVIGEAYDDAVHEHDLTVVAETEAPDLEELEWEPGDALDVTFRCEVMPELELEGSDYEGLQLEVPDLEPTDEMLEQEMERFARQFATWEEVSGAGIDWDDHVTATVSVPEAD
ncbi:MAG: trigger factor family protein, partial [Candidatus Brocadiia bacterium]